MPKENEPQPGSNFLGKHKKLIRAGATSVVLAYSAFFSACEAGDSAAGPEPVPSATMPAELPTPFNVGPDYEAKSVLAHDGFKVHLNSDGLPVRWIDWHGNPHEFDLGAMRTLKEKAIVSGEPEIIELIPFEAEVKTSSTSSHFEKAHPILKELPDDVMSDEELEARGVKIVQADRTKFYIRKGAFEDGQPLAGVRKNDPNRTLTIVLFDGDFVSPYYMQDERYLPYANSLPRPTVDALHFRSDKIEGTKKILDELRVSPGVFREKKADLILAEKSKLFHYMYLAGDSELLEEAAFDLARGVNETAPGGAYATTLGNDAIIYLAVGTNLDKQSKYSRLYFDPAGNVVADGYTRVGTQKLHYFQQKDSFPDPELFMRNILATCENGGYLFGAQSVGNTLRHELHHEKSIGQAGTLKDCEATIDKDAMEEIGNASDRWEGSGYQDNLGYPYVFSSPDGDGYHLTATEDYINFGDGF